METLFNESDCGAILARLGKLTSESQHRWGKMDAAQMLTHVHRALQTASGDLQLPRTLMGYLFGKIAIKKLIGEAPWGKNMPTDKNFVVTDKRVFEEEKRSLLESVRRFQQAGPSGVSKYPHPFFGKLTPEDSARLHWRHLDHHL